jgi:hypothetical protein
MMNEELDVDSDDETDLETERESTCERSGDEQSDSESESVCTGLHEIHGGIYCSDHYCATYSFLHKYLKWWRKLFWCMEVSIVNAYILYCCHKTQLGAKPVPHVRY